MGVNEMYEVLTNVSQITFLFRFGVSSSFVLSE